MNEVINLPNADESTRQLVQRLYGEIKHKQALIDKLNHENAVLKRLKLAAKSEQFNAEQRNLLEETLDEDTQAVADEIAQLQPASPDARQTPKRQSLPAALPH